MDMMEARLRMMTMQAQGLLPPEYQQIEYIGTSAKQYIDTEIIPTIETELYCEFSDFDMVAGGGNTYAGVGGAGSSGSWVNVSTFHVGYTNSWASFGSIVDRTFSTSSLGLQPWNVGKHSIKISKNGTWMDNVNTNVNFANATFSTTTDTICFGARKSAGNISRYVKVKLHRIIIKENNIVVCNMIPCIRKSDNKPGMYDIKRKKFFTKVGTDEFIIPQ